jgi:hypothetical protein
MNTIQSNTNYVIFKKVLSIHSEDRDITKWPESNHFEVTAPVEYKNVISLRLNNIEIPSSYYIFSEKNQNVKLSFKVLPRYVAGAPPNYPDWPSDSTSQLLAQNLSNSANLSITIVSGSYDYTQLAYEINEKLNKAVSDFTGITYNKFALKYNTVNMKLMFINSQDNFRIDFSKQEVYDTCVGNYYENYTNWGLGSYIGFNKKVYNAVLTPSVSMAWNSLPPLTNVYYLEPEHILDLFGESHVYMELMYYNSMDEIAPYAEKSSSSNNAKFGGKHNAAFAKIPLFARHVESFSSRDTYLSNVFTNDPPLERIQKFKIKMRFHDGRVVDFNNSNYNFTIEICMLKPDTIKPYLKVNQEAYGSS